MSVAAMVRLARDVQQWKNVVHAVVFDLNRPSGVTTTLDDDAVFRCSVETEEQVIFAVLWSLFLTDNATRYRGKPLSRYFE